MKIKSEKGGIIIELALTFPIILIFIFFIIWISNILNQRSSFSSAVANATRLAVTRGNPILMGFDPLSIDSSDNLIPAVQKYGNGETADMQLLLSSDDLRERFETKHNQWINEVFPGYNLKNLPHEYVYTLIYIYQTMKSSVGKVRFPCDPDGEPPEDGAGCIKCMFVDPNMFRGQLLGEPSEHSFGVECEYSPNDFLLNILSRLINSGETKIKFRRASFYNLLPPTGWVE